MAKAAAAPVVEAPKPQVIVRAQPGPQTMFLSCPVPIVLMGGARGGSKSFSLLLDAIHRDALWGKAFRGLLLRKTLPELVEIKRIAADLFSGIGGHWRETDHLWTLPKGGTLRMSYLDRESDADQFQGWQLSALYFDEVGNMSSLAPIDRLWGSLRSPEGIPVVLRMTANPGGPCHQELYERFVKWGDCVVHKYQPQPELNPDYWIDSVFIKSTVDDNPALLKKDPDYVNRLSLVGDKDLYKAWRFGDWDILRGSFFGSVYRPEKTLVDDTPQEPYFTRWASADWGFAHASAVYWACTDGVNTYIYKERIFNEKTPTELAHLLVEATGDDKLSAFYLSPDAFARRSTPRAISDEMNEVFRKADLPLLQRADNNRVSGWQLMADMFAKGTLKIHRCCEALIKAIPLAQRNPDHPEDILKTSNQSDDALDACRYLLQSHPKKHVIPYELALQRSITAQDCSWKLVQYLDAKRRLQRERAPLRIGASR